MNHYLLEVLGQQLSVLLLNGGGRQRALVQHVVGEGDSEGAGHVGGAAGAGGLEEIQDDSDEAICHYIVGPERNATHGLVNNGSVRKSNRSSHFYLWEPVCTSSRK